MCGKVPNQTAIWSDKSVLLVIRKRVVDSKPMGKTSHSLEEQYFRIAQVNGCCWMGLVAAKPTQMQWGNSLVESSPRLFSQVYA